MATAGRSLGQWLEHIGSVHYRSIDLTLDRVRRVAHVLRIPAGGRYVTVAGTNGKGSSVAFLESIYRAAGYTTGAYTSPHLVRYNERVRIDGSPVPDTLLEAAFEAVEHARCDIPLTYFEFGTLAALWVLREVEPDIAILEVGMGGRLDAVNIVDSEIALITEIGLDHQQWLGSGVDQIAREKAGVLRHRGLAVSSGVRSPAILAELAQRKHCDFWQLGRDFGYEVRTTDWDWLPLSTHGRAMRPLRNLPIPAGGIHQVNNAAGVVTVVRCLETLLPVADEDIVDGIRRSWAPGRLQLANGEPEMLFDVSHNADGLAVLSTYLRQHPVSGRLLGVFSMLADKDIVSAVTRVGDLIDHWFIAPIDNERAADAATLGTAISKVSSAAVDSLPDVAAAVDRALSKASAGDRVVVFGSFYAVGDIMRHLHIDPYPASR